MVTMLRADGLFIVIYLNDHALAHVHVFGDGEAKINLIGTQSMADLIWADGSSRAELRRAMRLVAAQQAFLLRQWEDIRGRVD